MRRGVSEVGARAAAKAARLPRLVRAYSNWPEAVAMATLPRRGRSGPRVIRCRNGVRAAVRPGTSDLYILSEAFAYGAYQALEPILRNRDGECAVVDLGAHIGAFTLFATQSSPRVTTLSFEPGPDNAALLRRNVALNPALAPRIQVHEAGVGARSGVARWLMDPRDPSGSRLVEGGQGHEVSIRSLRDVLSATDLPIACVKIDVEGGEYDLLDGSDRKDWDRIPAVLAELHEDPAGRSSPDQWLARMRRLGYVETGRDLETVVLIRS